MAHNRFILNLFNKRPALFVFFFLVSFSGFPQQQSQNFLAIADSIITVNHKTYNALDYAIYKNKYDTLKMKMFLAKSLEKNYPQGEVYAYIMLGNQYRNKSLFKTSKNFLNQALIISKQKGLIEFHIVSLNMLGVVERRLDNIKSALGYHQDALKLAEQQPIKTKSLQKSIAVCHNSIGNIYLSLKQYDLALEEFNSSLEIEMATNNSLGLAINYHNIGAIYEAQNKLNAALKNYKISLQYNEKINSNVGRVICNTSIGSVYVKQNNPEAALKIIEPTIALAEKNQDQFYIAFTYITLGWAHSKLNHLELAETWLTKGLNVAIKYELKSSISSAYLHLSELNEKKNNYELALTHYKKAIELNKNILSEKNAQFVSSLRLHYETEKKNSQIQSLAIENEIVKLRLDKNNKMGLLLLSVLLLLGVALFFLYRHRELKSEKMILTLEQDMLRNQMNPHFIFNSLNSIKLYIINNEKEKAIYYLTKFSKFIRKILVASTEKQISIAEELETMSLYMNIENIRFSNHIKYTTVIDPSIDIDNVKLPSLVLQPFLENALWHGLSPKKEDKSITVHVYKSKKKFVTISISDNGIGRKASEAIKENKVLKRKSLGIEITKKRLENFSKRYTHSYTITIEDLYDNDAPSGTKVTLNIPTKAIKKLR
ncbi:tetratricopeptide repeat protein [Bizionia gelidisalsuginis]|uniref:Tetratricopeptide repeat protein n=2 Tax=Bizionia TaxID=283785 RepID=A0A8H2LDB4_9FLAO|nr:MULTISPECIES: tetratricopeptide repeat protein [Bizionia]TYB76068.1 tetratricopeptide repeat protein [Bizionia saleffrena]TYC11362.1 tetratricopeptide repeat protein [Bizionia gelidisalsuginis]